MQYRLVIELQVSGVAVCILVFRFKEAPSAYRSTSESESIRWTTLANRKAFSFRRYYLVCVQLQCVRPSTGNFPVHVCRSVVRSFSTKIKTPNIANVISTNWCTANLLVASRTGFWSHQTSDGDYYIKRTVRKALAKLVNFPFSRTNTSRTTCSERFIRCVCVCVWVCAYGRQNRSTPKSHQSNRFRPVCSSPEHMRTSRNPWLIALFTRSSPGQSRFRFHHSSQYTERN